MYSVNFMSVKVMLHCNLQFRMIENAKCFLIALTQSFCKGDFGLLSHEIKIYFSELERSCKVIIRDLSAAWL